MERVGNEGRNKLMMIDVNTTHPHGIIWHLTPLREFVSDSLQNLQTLSDPCSELPLTHLLA